MKKIKIKVAGLTLSAELLNTPTAEKVYKNLPITSKITTWGEEIYFPVPFPCNLEPDCKQVVEIGDICFWTTGQSIAIFFGKTPVSEGNEPRAYEPVNVFGKIKGDAKKLKKAKDRTTITIEKA